jgi:hypothetical protein
MSAVDGSFDGLLEALKERLKPNTDDTVSQIASAPSMLRVLLRHERTRFRNVALLADGQDATRSSRLCKHSGGAVND